MGKAFSIPTIFKAIDKLTAPVKWMGKSISDFAKRSQEEIARFDRQFRSLANTAKDVAKKSAIVGFAIAAPLILAARSAIAFEDRMADVSKTTGIVGKDLDTLGKGILALAPDTRTTIEELQQITAIGGAMGIAKDELLGFTDSVNKFNVALGSDFGGVDQASKAISGLKTLFKETRDIKVADAITKTGSAINALSSKGVNVPEVTEFITRIGQLPDAIKPSIQSTAALAAAFNKSGLTAEIASRAFGDVLLTGAQNLPKFAKQMKMTEQEASKLINSDPTAFALKFADSLKNLNAQQLAKTLKSLKLTDAGAIKTVGALGSSTKMLAEFQSIANDEFAKGTSLLNEYNTKNETTAAKLKKAQNAFQALSITVGTELLPVVNDLLKDFMPVLKSMLAWTRNNPKTVKTILMLAASISLLSFVVSGISSAIFLYAQIMLIANNATKVVTAAQWLWNAAMTANPIGLIIVGIAALIAGLYLVTKHWNEWGAAVSMTIPGLGTVLSLIQSFRRNWDMLKEAFKTGGLIGLIKALGKVLLDAFIMPLQQAFKLIADITGAQWATNMVKGFDILRHQLGVNTETDESGQPLTKPALNPEVSRREAAREYNSTLTINDKTGRAELGNENPMISLLPQLSTTASF